MIHSGTLDRLTALGRTKGHLTNEDLRAELPVDSMSADEIALVIVELEDAGIAVELDESLLGAGPRGAPAEIPAIDILSRERDAQTPPARSPDRSVATAAPAPADVARPFDHRAGPSAHKAVLVAGLLVLALLMLGLFLLRS